MKVTKSKNRIHIEFTFEELLAIHIDRYILHNPNIVDSETLIICTTKL